MAKLISAKTKETKEIPNGKPIRETCEEFGIPFQCTNGICGTCMIDIVDGEENLSELTEAENDLERDRKHRLACQCKIKKGKVTIDF